MVLITLNPILLVLILSISIVTSARELRPSDHGLGNQTDPPSASTDQLISFYNSTTGSDVAVVALPKPSDSSDPDWWKKGQDESSSRKQRGGLLKRILLITSFVCGIAGAVFLLAAAVVYAFRFRTNCRTNEGDGLSK